MQDVGRDIRLAVRSAIRTPGYALAVIATLAIGIGANTAIFSLFNWILFRPLPGVSRTGDLVTVKYQTSKRDSDYFVSFRDYADLRDNVTTSLLGLAAAAPRKMDLSTGGDPERIDTEVVTANYLALLGVQPALGRDFLGTEDQPGSGTPVIISHRLWRRSFGSDDGVLGRTLRLNGRPFTIVGVAPAGFQGRSTVTAADLWLTISGNATLAPADTNVGDLLTSRRSTMFGDAIGRLRPGASMEQAQAESDALVARIPDFATAFSMPGRRSEISPVFYPGVGHERDTKALLTRVFRLMMGAVGLLLLLACANAANLLLARGTARRREIAVAQAIGASRFRVIRQQLAEGLVLSVAAGVLGLALAAWLTWLFDGMRIVSLLPAVSGVALDWRVCAFAVAATLLTGLIFSAAPAIVSSRVDLQSSLKDGVTSSRGGRRLLRGTLVTLQVGVSVVLLVAAGLFIRTLQNIRGLDLGVESESVVSASINPSRFGANARRSAAYVRDLLEGIRNAPGITSAAFTWTTSFSSNRANAVYTRPEDPMTAFQAATTAVSPGFFTTMGIPLMAGRDFTDAEARDANAPVVIISQALARQAFPNASPIGSQLTLRFPKGKTVEVIGIAGDVRGKAVTTAPEPWSYTPAVDPTWGTIQVRSALPPGQVAATIREVARRIDPILAPHEIEGFGAAVDRAISEQRLFARTSGIFALVAAVLAGIGIYGMMAGAVAERRKEFGIRLALGAGAGSILGLVMRSAAMLSAMGLLLGMGGAAASRRVLESRLFGVNGLDPVTLGATVAAIVVLTIVASLVPAIRAARVDPVRSLRVDA